MSPNLNNVISHFLTAAKKHPDNIAIIEKGKSISYRELEAEVRSTAAYFTESGIKQGDRVLVFVPMSIDLYRTVLALFYVGATAVFLDEWVTKERLLLCCRLADCKGFIGPTKARIMSWFAKDLRQIPIKLSLSKRGQEIKEPAIVNEDHSALITFTTGSTGTPKAADRSHTFLDAQFQILKKKVDTKPGDIEMTVLPIVLFINLGVGATSVLADYNSRKPQSLNPALIINQLRKNKVERIISSPYFIKTIAQYLISQKVEVKTLREIYTGGAPVFSSEANIYREAFPDSDIKIIYGSTEAEPISSISANQLIKQSDKQNLGLPVGNIHPQTKLKIIKLDNSHAHNLSVEELENITLKENDIGEILVAGNHVLKKYYNNPQAFRKNKIIVEGEIWHRTGDSGFLQNKQLFLTGNCKQLIRKNRQLLSPFVTENYLSSLPSVKLGTLVEQNDILTLVLETDKSAQELEPAVATLVYDQLKIVKKIPRDPRHNSKIDYGALQILLNK
jgi:acyl-CoA synthetase (AMP-forming)/AMP-acid ligase II